MKFLIILYMAWGFPHSVHYENEVECKVCHGDAYKSERSSDLLLPEENLCLDCHEESMGYKRPSPETPWIANFSHNLHRETGCERCHGDPSNPVLPQMATCVKCHDGVITKDCYSCHERGEERLIEYHPPRWRSLHSEIARGEEEGCYVCHEESQGLLSPSPVEACENCHIRENIKLQMHPENFLYQHPQSFYSREMDCRSCHGEFQDCRSCHRERGIYPAYHNYPNWLTFGGGEHGEEAERDPEKCLSCHGGETSICSQCHGGE
jgi:predicted CXXCH cytochrome family protein